MIVKISSRFILVVLLTLGITAYLIYPHFYSKTWGWQTYTNSNPVYSLRYPSGWNIDSSGANLTSSTQSGILSISKDGLEFQVISYADGSSALKFPNICQFSDSNYKGNLILGDKYTEIKSNKSIYRVTEALPLTGGSAGVREVCFKKKNEEKFSNIIGRMNITYMVTENYSDNDVNTMNQMLSTLHFEEE